MRGSNNSARVKNVSTEPPGKSGNDSVLLERKKALIEMELQMERLAGNFYVPSQIPEKCWDAVFKLDDAHQRRSYYSYLKHVELDRDRIKRKHRRKTAENWRNAQRRNASNPDHLQYGVGKNFLFYVNRHRMYDYYKLNLVHGTLFGPKVVVDLGYEDYMGSFEMKNILGQLAEVYSVVKRDKDPFHLHFCNSNPDGEMASRLKTHLPFLREPDHPVTLTEKSYLDLFEKERIVYLTPNSSNCLRYSSDDVYVIGGMIGKFHKDDISSHRKALKEGVRTARFPIDEYLRFRSGSRSLALDQVMKILVTLKNTNNWKEALEHVPKRKIRDPLYVWNRRFNVEEAEKT